MYPAGAVIERHGFLFKIYRCSEPPSSKDNRLYGQGPFFIFPNLSLLKIIIWKYCPNEI